MNLQPVVVIGTEIKRGKLQIMYQAAELVIGYPADGCMPRRMGSMVSSGCTDCSAFSSSSGVSPDLSRSIEATVFFFDFLLPEEEGAAAGVEACCAAAAAIASSLEVSEAVAPAPASLSLFMSRAACMAEVMAAAVVAEEEEDGAEDASLE